MRGGIKEIIRMDKAWIRVKDGLVREMKSGGWADVRKRMKDREGVDWREMLV